MPHSFALEQVQSRSFAAVELHEPLRVSDLPTPALVLNRAALDRNIAKMAEHVRTYGKGFRPHAKTHKCPLICQAQIAAGAVGVCAAKVSEAAALVAAGLDNVLITSPITTELKVGVLNELLLLLADQPDHRIMLVVDSSTGLEMLQRGIHESARLGLLVDMDVAMGRTGTRDSDQLMRLVGDIEGDDRFRFVGIQHYAGHLMHVSGFAERREQSLALWDRLTEKIACLEDHRIEVEVITGCGTGTYNIDVEVDLITDLQVGSYIFMDEEYCQIGARDSSRFDDFEVALTVACATISQPTGRRITVDGGYKAFASETVAPVARDIPGVEFHFAGDEHGVLLLGEGQQDIRLGQVLQFVSPHCDPTVNLHDFYWVQEEDEMIHSCWPITGRGCSW